MAAGAGGTVAWLIGAIKMALTNKWVQGGALGMTLADGFGIDIARGQAVRISPLSDPEALEFAARNIHWMMGLADNDIIGPRNVADWNYFHYNPRRGLGWWTKNYTSRGTTRGARRRGFGRGFGKGLRRAKVGY